MKSVVLWTGGKDCALAMLKAQQLGYEIVELITFAPKNPDFKAHPIHIINKQIELIGLPHQFVEIESPFDKSYEIAIQGLIDQGVECLITGDIDLVNLNPNWIDERCAKLSIEVFKPLWQVDREIILCDLLKNGFQVILSAVDSEFFDKDDIGLEISNELMPVLKSKGIDICGENGEYHTIVTSAPFFKSKMHLLIGEKVKHNNLYVAKFSFLEEQS